MAEDSSLHFRILEDIARDLSGDISFPICMDAAILIRNTLKDPFANLTRVTQVVGFEPLISSKLLRLANSVIYNPAGNQFPIWQRQSPASALTWFGPPRLRWRWIKC